MKKKINILSILVLLSLIMIFLGSCDQKKSSNQTEQQAHEGVTSVDTPNIVIDSFTELSDELGPCLCVFSEDSAQYAKYEYIFASDFDVTASMKINGEMKIFKLIDDAKPSDNVSTYKTKDGQYQVIVNVTTERKTSHESADHTGTIELSDSIGHKVTMPYFGSCGC